VVRDIPLVRTWLEVATSNESCFTAATRVQGHVPRLLYTTKGDPWRESALGHVRVFLGLGRDSAICYPVEAPVLLSTEGNRRLYCLI
jgi:hypothetical protein